jgi:hypothetical protein
MFDYVYASSIEEADYKSSEYVKNLYQGQFSNDVLNTAYGNILYNANNSQDDIGAYKLKDVVDEFGIVVREIAYIKTKIPSRPSFPIAWTTGVNNLVTILGSKTSSFEAEAYILNNSSVRVPLSDGTSNTLAIVGNSIGSSGEIIYSTDETLEYSFKEPIIFESTWIQNQEDAKKLAEWIKAKIANKSSVLNMNVFGNPLISVGDIVSVVNVYQEFYGTEKLIVTNVSHSFKEGIETSITCRTI